MRLWLKLFAAYSAFSYFGFIPIAPPYISTLFHPFANGLVAISVLFPKLISRNTIKVFAFNLVKRFFARPFARLN
jgi:hypothetical protein